MDNFQWGLIGKEDGKVRSRLFDTYAEARTFVLQRSFTLRDAQWRIARLSIREVLKGKK